MIFPKKYKCIQQQFFALDNFKIIPIRFKDQFHIMQWRNDQIDILRQSKLLTTGEQKAYFSTTIRKLFDETKPKQLLFSFVENGQMIGYGGLVHIDWKNQHAEISFLLETSLNSEQTYIDKFSHYLKLIIEAAKSIKLHKISTYGYNTAAYRFTPLISLSFDNEAVLKKHKMINGKLHDVLIYSKIL